MTRRLLALMFFGALLAAALRIPPAHADVHTALAAIRHAHGHYQPGAASLIAADCSGLVSVAQSLAMGQAPHRLGSTRSLLAGRWPGAIPGATRGDAFVIGANRRHMVAQVAGVPIEARSSGERFRIGPDARSPFTFAHVYHVSEELISG